MRLRVTITVSVCSLILIGCAAFPRHPDRKPTIWEVISAYTNPAGDAADSTAQDGNGQSSDGQEQDNVAAGDASGNDEAASGAPTPTLLPGTRVSVAQTRVYNERIALTAAALPTGTLLPGTRVAVAQTRVFATRLAVTQVAIVAKTEIARSMAPTDTLVTTGTVGSGTRVAIAPTGTPSGTPSGNSTPTDGDATKEATSRATSSTAATERATTRATARATSTPRNTPTKRPTSTPTAKPTKPPTPATTPTRRVAPTQDAPPTSPPSPPQDPIQRDVYIRSHSGIAESGEYVVVGEIINGEDYPVYGARIVATFYDSSGNLIGAQEEMANLPKTHTEQSNPFRLAASDPAGQVESYELTLVWEDISVVDFAPVTVQGTEVDDDDKLELTGELLNAQSTELTSIIITVAFYDEEGAVLAVYRDFFGGQTLAPGDTMPYTLTIPDPDLEYDTFYVQAQGNLNLY